MKILLIIAAICLSGCASKSCDWMEGMSIGSPDEQSKNVRIIPKYWNI